MVGSHVPGWHSLPANVECPAFSSLASIPQRIQISGFWVPRSPISREALAMLSQPKTPSGKSPKSERDYRFKTNGTACEWGEAYHPNGYHPVHLQDVLNSRYRVIRKLGYGSYSTVWLAVDRQFVVPVSVSFVCRCGLLTLDIWCLGPPAT